MKIKVGTSGFGLARAKYIQQFSCVEVQHTFYQPPGIPTLKRWRAAAPPDFEFVVKAWQLITHDARSPTYRRLKKKLTEGQKKQAGYFRATPLVQQAWETTLACARALSARTILFQCPASFKQTQENLSNLKRFFSSINRCGSEGDQLNLAWEPRGDWDQKVVKTICDELNLWHVVDPFTARSVTPERFYFRLHGRTGWRYEYEAGELRELATMLVPRKSTRRRNRFGSQSVNPMASYVFFNNVRMTQDALRFRSILDGDSAGSGISSQVNQQQQDQQAK